MLRLIELWPACASIIFLYYVLPVMLSAAMIFFLQRGHNWMRILLAIMVFFGILSMFWMLPKWLLVGGWRSVVLIVSYTLQVIAVVLVFFPSAQPWYRRKSQETLESIDE